MKRRVTLLLLLLLSLTALSAYAVVPAFFEKHQGLEPVRVTLNGDLLTGDVPPFLIDGKTVVPLDEITQQMGLIVNWNQKQNQVQIYKPRVNMLVMNEALNKENKTAVEPLRVLKRGVEYQLAIYAEVDQVPTTKSFNSKIVLVSPKGEEVESFFKNGKNQFSTGKKNNFKVQRLEGKGTFAEAGDYKLLFMMEDFDSKYVVIGEKLITVD